MMRLAFFCAIMYAPSYEGEVDGNEEWTQNLGGEPYVCAFERVSCLLA